MIIKILLFIVFLVFIYVVFFKKKSIITTHNKKDIQDNSEVMVECSSCGLFISSKDSVIKDGRFYCSKECAKL